MPGAWHVRGFRGYSCSLGLVVVHFDSFRWFLVISVECLLFSVYCLVFSLWSLVMSVRHLAGRALEHLPSGIREDSRPH